MGLPERRFLLTDNNRDITKADLAGIEVVDGGVDVRIRTEE